MENRILIWCLFCLLPNTIINASFINPYPKVNIDYERYYGDSGDPLFLTPLIERGYIWKARQLARVPLTEYLGVESYSGFFTVNKTLNSNHFFWYFPPTAAPPADAPVLLWLQGGPGASSLFGLFTENGPIMVEDGEVVTRRYHWALNHHVIYIDSPVGTGFSFTREDGYAKDEVQVGKELHESMKQFFKLFPQLRHNKFFITGESYAGKYIPALGYTIHMNNNSPNDKINLKGMAIGNGWCDPIHQMLYGKYIYELGLIDNNQRKEFINLENHCRQYIKHEEWWKAYNCSNYLVDSTYSLFSNFTGLTDFYNFLKLNNTDENSEFVNLIQLPHVRKSIHVGNRPYYDEKVVERYLAEDILQSMNPWIIELLNHYDIVFYNGQLDVLVAYAQTENFLQHLAYKDAKKYKTAKRHIWKVDDDVAGYVKTAGKLTEILVRNAGHMVPTDQPEWALDLITRFTHGKPYY